LRKPDAQGKVSAWQKALGGIHGSGMASFKDVLNLEQPQQILNYINHQTVLTGLPTAADK